jgi:DNA-binding beta-propeller fold protein YncE
MNTIAHTFQRRRRVALPAALAVLAAAMLAWATPALAASRIYWGNLSNSNTISYADLDGSGNGGQLDTGGATINGPWGEALDPATNRIYWANYYNNTISYANLDGSGSGGQLDTSGATLDGPFGVTIDPATNTIYWANFENSTISYANLDGSGNGGQLNTTGATVDLPAGVTIDPATNTIYWVNFGADTVSYANLNGSGGGDLDSDGATFSSAVGAAIDPTTNTIYWANFGNNTISYANLDGSGGGQLNVTGATFSSPEGVAIDPATNTIYWANHGNDTISYANLDGSGGGQLDTSGATPVGPVNPVLLESPSGTGAPSVSGADTAGATLTCSGVTWAPDLTGSFLYQAPTTQSYGWTLNGVLLAGATAATLTASSPGNYACQVTAANAAGSSTQASLPYMVNAAPTSTILTSSANPSTAGQQVTYTAAVTPIAGAGTLSFTEDGLPISGCTALPIDPTTGEATCRLTYSAPGVHNIEAGFSGDGTFTGSQSAALSQTVNPASAKPSCTLTSRHDTKSGQLNLALRCDQTVSISLSGKITVTAPARASNHGRGKKATIIELPGRHSRATKGKLTDLVVKLPSSALDALRAGSHERLVLSLSISNENGTAHTSTTFDPVELMAR